MFLRIGNFTINTDNINYAERMNNNMTYIRFSCGGADLTIPTDDADKIWAALTVEPVDDE